MKRLLTISLIAVLFAPIMASAHTISIGTVNGGTNGTVTIYMGTYQSGHGTVAAEGAITIGAQSVNFGSVTASGAKPAGLIDGANNFFASGGTGNFNSSTNGTGYAEVFWQSATLVGLAAGSNGYTISGMGSVNWADVNSGAANWTGTLTIPQSSISTPEPGALALLGLGLAGLGFARRRAV
jgi:hypothetical protein